MKIKRLARILSVVLSLLLIFQACPVLAETHGSSSLKPPAAAVKPLPNVVGEAVKLRDANTKHYRLEDGSFEAIQYKYPIHYKDGKDWAEIDNSLGKVSNTETPAADRLDTAGGFENKANSVKVRFAENTSGSRLVSVRSGSTGLSWGVSQDIDSPLAATFGAAETLAGEETLALKEAGSLNRSVVASVRSSVNGTEKTRLPQPKNLSSGCLYPDIFPGVDLSYMIISQNVKEQIILKAPSSRNTFAFQYHLKGLSMRNAEDGGIDLVDTIGAVTYHIPKPFMMDALGAASDAVTLDFSQNDEGWQITISADETWLSDPNRAFPVIIDPDLQTTSTSQTIHETFVASYTPNTNYTSYGMLLAGRESSAYGVCRTYIKFDLPALPSSARVIGANLNLAQYRWSPTSFSNYQLNVKAVTGTLNTNSLTWNSQPTVASTINDYCLADGSVSWRNWDVTDLVGNWYTTGVNNGLVVMAENEAASTIVWFYSSDNIGLPSENYPSITFRYIDTKGLEGAFTTHALGLGRAGTASIQDLTGNLVVSRDDIGIPGNRLPVSIRHIYDLSRRNEDIGYGKGWRTNYDQKINAVTIGTTNYYQHVDEDGTDHYFKYNSATSKWEDELESSRVLTINTGNNDAYYTITDKDGNKLEFVNWGVLRRIKDNKTSPNTIQLEYPSINGVAYLCEIRDAANRVYRLNRDGTSGRLLSIDYLGLDSTVDKSVTFSYTNGYLTKVTDPDGLSTFYSYDESGSLSSAMDVDGATGIFTYSGSTIKRIAKINQYAVSGEVGSELGFDYGVNTTAVSDIAPVFSKKSVRSGVDFVNVQAPDGSGLMKAVRLNKDVAVPAIYSEAMALIPGATYKVEFDYWADAANTNFHVDFYPDTLPQQGYTASTSKQHTEWTVQSSSESMTSAVFRIFNDRYATNPANIYVANVKITKTGGGFPIDPGSAIVRSGVDVVSVTLPQTSRTVKAFKIPSSSSFSVAEAAQLTLKPDTNYRVSFDYWSDSGSVPFSVDLFPDDLPEVAPTATTTVQRYNFTINSSSGNLKSAMLRFYKVGNANIGNIYISNIELCETAKASSPVLVRDGIWERINIYHFSAAGTTVDIMDEEGRAVYYHYGSGTGDNKKLTLASKLQRPVVNMLLNGSAEADGYFSEMLWGVPNGGGFARDANDKKLGLKSIKLTSDSVTATRRLSYQNVNLEARRTYTMSAWVKTSGVTAISGVGADLYVYKDSEIFQSQVVNGTNDWQRITLTFTPSMTAVYTVCVGLANAAGTAWFDGIQLEEGVSASRYNLVENAGFEYGSGLSPSLWTSGGGVAPDGVVSGGSESPKAYSILGSATASKNIQQNINVSCAQGDAFVLSGFAKAPAAQIKDGRQIHLFLKFNYLNGVQKYFSVSFNTATDDWQYLSETFVAEYACDLVTVFATYVNEVNTVLFDNIQLYKEEFGQSYVYDSKGNVTSTVDLAKQKTDFQYENDLLKKLVKPDGSEYTYTYDDQKNLTSATSSEGVKYSFTYDGYGNPLKSDIEEVTPSGIGIINTSATYTLSNGNYQTSVTDERGKTTQYGINETFGVKETVTDPNNNATTYGYNASKDLLTSVSASDGTRTITNSYAYARGQLTSIAHNGFSYQFEMDGLKNQTAVKVGSQTLVTNTFGPGNGPLKQSTDGNGQTVSFTYDRDGQLIEKAHGTNGADGRYRYFYDREGNVYRTEEVNGTSYTNTYDLIGRLVRTDGSNGHGIQLSYDAKNRLSALTNTILGQSYKTGYIYGDKTISGQKDGLIYGIKVNDTQKLSYTYDALARRATRTIHSGGTFATSYGFLAGNAAGKTTTMVETVNNGSQAQIKYTYDANGNIKTISESDILKATFHYDQLNQLVREDSVYQNKTIQYVYDAGGNMTQRTEHDLTSGTPGVAKATTTYLYQDNNWKDKLTKIIENGTETTIGYDNIGNPDKSLVGWNLSWQRGRNLATATRGSDSVAYTYNDNGIRTRKTVTSVNSVDTNYYLNGDSVVTETSGNDRLDYFYDEKGNLFGFRLNGADYYYVRNGQKDIIGILNSNLTQVVTYAYDSWGKLLSMGGDQTVGAKNPYRYRGYRYDTETGFYYLNSRYYDPQVRRFLNADATNVLSADSTFTDKNLFAYCDNNPVIRRDASGEFWDTIFDVVSLVVSITDVIKKPNDEMAWVGLAADVVSLAIPGLTGGGTIVKSLKIADKVDDVIDTAKAIDKVDDVTDTLTTANKVHGNSLKTTKPAQGYALRNSAGEVMKYGETTRGTKRYSQRFIHENEYTMDFMASGSKADMHNWQHDQILQYKTQNGGRRPPENLCDW